MVFQKHFFLRQIQAKFDSIKYLTLLEVSNMTGCYPPCLFDEYRYQLVSKVEVSKMAARQTSVHSSGKAGDVSAHCVERVPLSTCGEGEAGLHTGISGGRVW